MEGKKSPNQESIEKLIRDRKQHMNQSVPSNLIERILSGDKQALSEAITLVESDNEDQKKQGQEIIQGVIPNSGKSIRIGITGVPGVGKSTFIESFGSHLTSIGKKVAVLAIDPTSERSGGSILGDKTRMSNLSIDPNAFIRPSASGGSLGGVAQKTRETILLCEACGFDVILVETVGVGQSEIAVHSMTDFFLLLMLAGAGDELQGIKRGIMEMADSIIITKADGDNVKAASQAKSQYKSALHLFPPSESGWYPKVETVSSLENEGMQGVWEIIDSFKNHMTIGGFFEENRTRQHHYWLEETLKESVLDEFNKTEGIQSFIEETEQRMLRGEITSFQASKLILEYYKSKK